MKTAAPIADLKQIRQRAHSIRRHVLHMAEIVGQGYVGQGLGIADLLATLYFGELRHDPKNPTWPDRDRFVLSIGHYAIGLFAAVSLLEVSFSSSPRWPKRESFRSRNWTPTAQTARGWKCPRPRRPRASR